MNARVQFQQRFAAYQHKVVQWFEPLQTRYEQWTERKEAYLQGLTAREQMAVRFMLVIVPLGALLGLLMWSNNMYQHAEQRVADEEQFYTLLISKQNQIKRTPLGQAIDIEVNQLASTLGLTPEMSALDESHVKVSVKHASYAVLANFLSTLQNKGMEPTQFSFEQLEDRQIQLQVVLAQQ